MKLESVATLVGWLQTARLWQLQAGPPVCALACRACMQLHLAAGLSANPISGGCQARGAAPG